jgi:Right handed beta helix region
MSATGGRFKIVSKTAVLGLGVLAAPLGSLFCGGCSSGDPGGNQSSATTTPTSFREIDDCGVVTENSLLGSDLTTAGDTCLRVAASGIEIDGNGHRISATQFAISWDTGVQPSNVTIRNVISSAGLQIFGESANGNRVESSTFGDVGIFMGSDNQVENSTMTRLVVRGVGANDVHHAVIRNNEIAGDNIRLVEFVTTDDTSRPCGQGAHEFTGNHVVGHAAPPLAGNTAPPDQVLLLLLCSQQMTVSGNLIESDPDHPGHGIHIRDDADDNLIENNEIHLPQAIGGIFVASGSAPRQHPHGNTVRGNFVETGGGGPALWVQAHDATQNVFEQNVFQSNGDPAGWLNGVQNRLTHNTFFNGGVGPALRLDDLRSPGNIYSSNIFDHSGSNTVDFSGDQPDLPAYQGDFNIFFNRAGPIGFGGLSFAQWRSQTGQDGNSKEMDPQFCAASSGDFKLKSSSPALGAGAGGTDAGAFPAGCS